MIRLPVAAESRAVLAGVSRYTDKRWTPLPGVRNNLDDLEAALTDPDLWGLAPKHCRRHDDPEDDGLLLDEIEQAASEATDTLLVYLAGHGLPLGSDLLLALAGARHHRPANRGLLFSALRNNLRGSGARSIVILLDCCFSGMAHMSSAGAFMQQQIDTAERPEGTYLLTSSAHDEISMAPPGERNTAFTGALLEVLRTGVPSTQEVLSLESITGAVKAALAARDMPEPMHSQVEQGNRIALVRNRAWRPAPVPTPAAQAEPSARSEAEEPGGAEGNVLSVPGSSSVVLQPYPDTPDALDPDGVRITPSLLLRADRGVVKFSGRTSERADFDLWRRGGGLRVRVLHAAGGQGKTRWARQTAEEWGALHGWRAWHAVSALVPDPAAGAAPAAVPATPDRLRSDSAGTLIVVDYADRRPTAELKALIQLAARDRERPVRVLLIGRTAGHWWTPVQAYVSRLGAHDTRRLVSHTPAVAARQQEFRLARQGFAEALRLPADRRPAPGDRVPDLKHEDFSLVLTVHMAALVDVLARSSGTMAPTDPAHVTADLLRREHQHWRGLLARAKDPQVKDAEPELGFDQMCMAVYAMTLTAGLRPHEARRALRRMEIPVARRAAEGTAADLGRRLLSLHAECYPPPSGKGGGSLQPLFPDRLAEDFLALTTPGQDDVDYPALMGAEDFAGMLLAPTKREPEPPPWTAAALRTLLETANRWKHMADGVLYPLLEQHPHLPVRAGDPLLAALVPLLERHRRTDLLLAIRKNLPARPGPELSAGTAAIQRALEEHDFLQMDSAVQMARRTDEAAVVYARAGHYDDALREARLAVTYWRDLADDPSGPRAFPGDVADALATRASLELLVGLEAEARASATEALRLTDEDVGPGGDPVAHARLLTSVAGTLQGTAGPCAHTPGGEVGADADPCGHTAAVRLARQARDILRELDSGPGGAHEADLAHALTVLCGALGDTGATSLALEAGNAAVPIWERLGVEDGSRRQELSEVLNLLGLYEAARGKPHLAVDRGWQAVKTLRRLARTGDAYRGRLANALANLASHYGDLATLSGDLEKGDNALAFAHEAQEWADTAGPSLSPAAAQAVTVVHAELLRRFGRGIEADVLLARHGIDGG